VKIELNGLYLWTSREGYSFPQGQPVQVYMICDGKHAGMVCFNTFPNEYDAEGASYCKSAAELSPLF
jgi:hypothetical protein